MNEQLRIIIAAEVSSFNRNVESARKKLKSFTKVTEEAKKKLKEFIKGGKKSFQELAAEFEKVGDTSKKFLGVATGAIAGAATALLALGASTKEYRQQQAMLATAFKTAGGSAESAKQTYNDLYRVLGDGGQATEAAQHLAKLTTEEKNLSEWTNICQGVYATFGESLPIESLTEAVNHTAKVGEVQGALADALEWSGVNMDEFNEQLFWCNSESEREKLIRDTLNGVYSDAAAAYETNNAAILAQNDAQTQLNESMAKLGEATAPIMTMLTTLGAEVLAQLAPSIEEFSAKYLPDITEALAKVGDAIGKVLIWIADHWELVSTLAAIVLGVAAALSVFSTVMGIVNAVMAASPVTWIVLAIVAAVAALVAIIVVIIKYWDEIKGAGVAAWELIKKAWSIAASWFNEKVIQPVINFFTNLWNKITSIASNIKNGVVNAFNGLKTGVSNAVSSVVNAVTNTFSKVTSALSKPVEKARDLVKGIIDKIKGFFKFEWSLPKLKVPKFSITPSGWQVGDLLQGVIPKLGITWNARGGVFDKPTLFNYGNSLQGIGENGAEAVVPLENNLEWLNKLADMLGDRMGVGTPVVLQVDGKTFATTSINAINKLTKQTGKLGLVLT